MLRNLVDADTVGQLRAREDRQVDIALIRLTEDPVPATFDLTHLRAVHDRLFERVYPWAGEVRSVDMSKGDDTPFVSWAAVESTFGYVADQVAGRGHFVGAPREQFVAGAAWTYNAVNTIHPFREGNGRAQRVWLDDLAAGAGWQLDWKQVTGRENDAVSRRAQAGELRVMEAMLDRITAPVDPETVEQRRVQRFAALLRTARPPLRETPTVSPTGPGAHPTAAREHGQDSGYGQDTGYGWDHRYRRDHRYER